MSIAHILFWVVMHYTLLLLCLAIVSPWAIAENKLWALTKINNGQSLSALSSASVAKFQPPTKQSSSQQPTQQLLTKQGMVYYSVDWLVNDLTHFDIGTSVTVELPVISTSNITLESTASAQAVSVVSGKVTDIHSSGTIDNSEHSENLHVFSANNINNATHIIITLENGSTLVLSTFLEANDNQTHIIDSSKADNTSKTTSIFASTIVNNFYYELVGTQQQIKLSVQPLASIDADDAISSRADSIQSANTNLHQRMNTSDEHFVETHYTHWQQLTATTPLADTHSEIENIDILVLFDSATAQYYQNSLPLKLANLQQATNQIFTASKVYLKVNFVSQQQIEVTNLAGNLKSILDALTFGDLQQRFSIEQRRYQAGADIVLLLLDPTNNNSGGYAWINGDNGNLIQYSRNMYMVMYSDMSSYVFAHELGHNLGLRHSRVQAPFIGATFDHATGHGVENNFVTLMAYLSDFQAKRRILQFSNPRQTCFNLPCGINKTNPHDGADASDALNQVGKQISQLHRLPVDLTPAPDDFSDINNPALSYCINQQYSSYPAYLGMFLQFHCDNTELSLLTGIDTLFNLQDVNITNTAVTDISPLADLLWLSIINLSDNRIKDISPLFHRSTDIEQLSLINNPVYCWQQSYLQQFEPIKKLWISQTCDASQDNNDYDYDGVSNQHELSQGTNPVLNEQGAGHIEFANAPKTIAERSEVVNIELYRPNGNIGTLTAQLTLASDTASTQRLSVENEQIRFKHGQVRATIALLVNDDNLENGDDIYTLTIQTDGHQSTIKLTVIDDDATVNTATRNMNENSDSGSGGTSYYLLIILTCALSRRIGYRISFALCER